MNKNRDIKSDVLHTANLARLKFSPDDLGLLAQKFGVVLKYVEQLNELDTGDIEPMSHAIDEGGAALLRNDEITESLSAKDILAAAPETNAKFIEVPKVIDGE